MLIIPAIDLRNGKVVRLFQGKFDQEKIYSSDPVKVAKHWVRQGAKFLHIVDLDGASSGVPKNLEVLKKILNQVNVPLEFGGGVRNMETISELLSLGVQRVVLGTRAANGTQFLKKAWKKFGEKIIVSIDAKGTKVLTQGWNKTASKTILDFAKELKEVGFKQLIYTDIFKDGALVGPNILGIKGLIKETGLNIIASGGVASLKDLLKLKKLQKNGLSGVIIGKALYEGKFTLAEALKVKLKEGYMEKRVLLLGVAVVFVVYLSGCSTTRKSKDLEIQGLRNQVSALESQKSAEIGEANSLGQVLVKSSEVPAKSLDKSGEVKQRPNARQIQVALKNAGYYQGVIDGKIGKQSRQAIKAFQKANNLSADGKIGKKTWLVLKEYLEKKVK